MALPEDENDMEGTLIMFNEPTGYYAKENHHTYQTHTLESGKALSLRLVAQNPLWGHMLWNAGQTIADFIEKSPDIVRDKFVLEFGAGVALPSLVCALNGAAVVVASDYPDGNLIENIEYNIENSSLDIDRSVITAEGFLWGAPVQHLTAHLPEDDRSGFHVLILADVVFNHSEHGKLVQSVRETLRPGGVAFVWFTPYRPWLLHKDLDFFRLADANGLMVEKMFERLLDDVLFENDPGDETLRRTVFAYKLTWK